MLFIENVIDDPDREGCQVSIKWEFLSSQAQFGTSCQPEEETLQHVRHSAMSWKCFVRTESQ